MKSRLLCALIAAVLCPLLSATTTISGTVRTLGTTVAKGSFVRFWLRGCKGNQPRVSGVAIFPANVNGQFYFDIPSDATGAVSGTLYSTRAVNGIDNGEIDCGGSLVSVWYGMQVFRNSVGGPEVPVHAKNTATLDISNVIPISMSAVVAAPTGDSTYLRLDGGNSPITGTLSVNAPFSVNGPLAVSGSSAISGSSTFNGSTAFNSPISFSSTFTGTNSGVFTDTQIHQYLKSMVGTGAFATYGQGGTTEAGTFGMTIPSNAVVREGDSIVGLVQSNCNSVGRTICNGVALSGHAWGLAAGSGAWGQNVTVQDAPGATAANLVGVEIDVGVGENQSAGWVHGLDIYLSPSVAKTGTMPTGFNGAALNIGNTVNAPKWSNGITIAQASTTEAAISIDKNCTSGPCDSPYIALASSDGSIVYFAKLSEDQQGNLLFTPSTVAGIRYPSRSFIQINAAALSNGVVLFCFDCKNVVDNAVVAGAACVGGGQGAYARRENNRWDCN